MTDRSEAQRRAEKSYAARMTKITITLSEKDAELLDITRGDRTRTSFAKLCILRALGVPMQSKADDFEADPND